MVVGNQQLTLTNASANEAGAGRKQKADAGVIPTSGF